ncbi:hypothetical protein CLV92_10949 [Kineococcus xinjiangensis]|uniref:Uncharacterized protein n=1 Tax=Kineococcus xinjiangensis TaxID=512762 RepID=A0A2S6IHS7_9ACTN|nr:hypothetical protein [Kineococcus xinjiangensis]PPK93773.1 hypothetical protein CLV92_10949 [Kineococcus xinjiangensis]
MAVIAAWAVFLALFAVTAWFLVLISAIGNVAGNRNGGYDLTLALLPAALPALVLAFVHPWRVALAVAALIATAAGIFSAIAAGNAGPSESHLLSVQEEAGAPAGWRQLHRSSTSGPFFGERPGVSVNYSVAASPEDAVAAYESVLSRHGYLQEPTTDLPATMADEPGHSLRRAYRRDRITVDVHVISNTKSRAPESYPDSRDASDTPSPGESLVRVHFH